MATKKATAKITNIPESAKPQRSTERSDDNARQRLLSAALNSFAEIEFEGSSIRGIADQAGVGFQLVAYYFGTKERLWHSAVTEAAEAWVAAAKNFRAQSDDPRERFRERMRSIVYRELKYPQLRRIFVQEFLAGSDRYSDVLCPLIRKFWDEIAIPSWDADVNAGVITGYTAKEAALIFLNMTLANLASVFQAEHLLGEAAGSAQLVEKEVELLYRQLTGTGKDDPSAFKRIVDLEAENRRLKEMVGQLSLDKELLGQRLESKVP